jgi:hypothetical protein
MTDPEDDFEPPASITELVDDVVADLTSVTRTTDTAATVLSRSDRPFAVLADPVLEVRLDPVVATAALRTPDATTSPRGSSWIRFAPSKLDRYAVDRVTAWLGYAWRHALD